MFAASTETAHTILSFLLGQQNQNTFRPEICLPLIFSNLVKPNSFSWGSISVSYVLFIFPLLQRFANHRARVIIFEIGWGPGCGSDGPRGGPLNVKSSGG